jgi:hypothetical protein
MTTACLPDISEPRRIPHFQALLRRSSVKRYEEGLRITMTALAERGEQAG